VPFKQLSATGFTPILQQHNYSETSLFKNIQMPPVYTVHSRIFKLYHNDVKGQKHMQLLMALHLTATGSMLMAT